MSLFDDILDINEDEDEGILGPSIEEVPKDEWGEGWDDVDDWDEEEWDTGVWSSGRPADSVWSTYPDSGSDSVTPDDENKESTDGGFGDFVDLW